MTRNLRNIWPTLLLCSALLGIGGVAGFLLRPLIIPAAVVIDQEEEEPTATSHGSNSIVELSETTLKNMELEVGKFESRNYFQTVRIPGQVVERIPQSRRSVTASIAGRVTKVYVAMGQAVQSGEKLFEVRITDESIATSQVALLDVFAKLDVNQAKLERLKPLVASGVTARTKLLDVEFEIKDLTDRRAALLQELSVRGMDDEMIQDFVKTKKLAQDVTIFAPDMEMPVPQKMKETALLDQSVQTIKPASTIVRPTTKIIAGDQYFTVETILALEGSNLELGETLCELTHHSDLLIRGLAFESDIDKVAEASEKGWNFTAQFGEGPDSVVREQLPLYLVGNHVDPDSQAFPIYVEIKNEIVNQTTDGQNRTYVNWRFKPGQRAHLEVPIESWEEQVVAPIQSVVREGPETFVFLKISHTHTADDGSIIHEFQKTPVKVLYADKRFAVLKKDSRLDIYEQYALNLSYQLNLALKQAAGSSADPHAGHTH